VALKRGVPAVEEHLNRRRLSVRTVRRWLKICANDRKTRREDVPSPHTLGSGQRLPFPSSGSKPKPRTAPGGRPNRQQNSSGEQQKFISQV
jgi:hypothetical protein